MTVLAFTARTNADLMADCHALGYLKGCVMDLTYGKGNFWTRIRPYSLVTNDIDPDVEADFHDDYTTRTVWTDGFFNTVVYDPPYKLNGTSTGKGPSRLDADYGVDGPYRSATKICTEMSLGLAESIRITSEFVLAKCQAQINAGRLVHQPHMLIGTANHYGATLVDELHVPGHREQPPGRRQVHARRNYSTLLVFKKDAT